MVNKIAKTTKAKSVKTGTKTSHQTVDKKGITEVTKKRQKAQKSGQRKQKTSVPSVIKKQSASSSTRGKSAGLKVPVIDIHGKSAGTINLPRQTFGQKPNPNLLAQAIRVYRARHIPHTAHTKTRGEVRGGGAKPWRQKGTGRARAGSRRSPLWVGGGIVAGPRGQARELSLPKKMKRQALIHALSDKAKDGNIKVISNIEKIRPKTKLIANLLAKLAIRDQNTLLVISQKNQNVKLATRNIPKFNLDLVPNLNAYEVLRNQNLLISKEAIAKFK